MASGGTSKVYGFRAYDWTRSKLKNCTVGPLATVPDLWDPFASFVDQIRVFRRAWDADPSVLLLFTTKHPGEMLRWWEGALQTFGEFHWFRKIQKNGPRAGVMLVLYRQADIDDAVKLKAIFPATRWILLLNPREPLNFEALAPDLVILGIDSTQNARALPLPLDWARSIRDQSEHFWFKSWGGWIPKDQGPSTGFYRAEKDGFVRSTAVVQPLLDGIPHKDLPEWFALPR